MRVTVTEQAVPEAAAEPEAPPVLRQDGPTVEEFVKAGYRAEHYPPQGFASRSTPEEVEAAVKAQAAAA